ncbi:MAG: agmatine deiminase [Verrucomicrobia bacterium]|nr:MAG: agmatine deiminase [Verrucomicrobiota bacterium]
MSTPLELGYRMPAEWEPHEATWVSWPHPDGISFPGHYQRVIPTFVRMVEILSESEVVRINVSHSQQEQTVRSLLKEADLKHVEFFHIPTNEPWCRDHGPIFVTRNIEPRLAAVDFGYNAWGWKYPPFDLDDAVPGHIATQLKLPLFDCSEFVLEGGSIDVNGMGALLTTKSCLLNPNRNPTCSQQQIEDRLKQYLGIREILWLGEGIEGDDTDGHVDDITRFVSGDTVVTAVEEDENDPNYEPLQSNLELLYGSELNGKEQLNILRLPMPAPLYRNGQRLPATYANFFIGNEIVLMPAFADTHDAWALSVLKEAFPTRKVVPLDCRELIWGLGAFHCLTQQQPSV